MELEELNLGQLIERAVSVTRPDPRITAAWLAGSFAAGAADSLSGS
jgi:hypothetical protein